jgi:hypothetical protein
VNIFSIVELLTHSIDDNKSSDIATECGARIYTYVLLFNRFFYLKNKLIC